MPPIDWTKPLEHVDGTPLIFCPNYKNPDTAGDYFLVREDGEPLTRARKNGTVFGCLIVKPDGHGWGAYNTGAPIVRNRAQPRAEAPATTWGAPISGEVMRTLNLPPDTPVKYCTRAATAELLHFDGEGDYQLRANHPYYLATSQGFAYWPGGDGAPADWDGGPVLLKNNEIGKALHWGRNTPAPHGFEGDHDIIGYRRKVEAPAVEAPAVATFDRDLMARVFAHLKRCSLERVARPNDLHREMKELVGDLVAAGYIDESVADPAEPGTVTLKRMTEAEARVAFLKRQPWQSNEQNFVESLRHLGLIREETLAERFTRETGHKVTPAVEAALEWERAA